MPLYVAAVAIRACRARVLACGDDGLEVYATLKRLRILTPGCCPDADALAREAAALYRTVPPRDLMQRKGIRLCQSVAAHAYLGDGRWHVPPEPAIGLAARGAARLAALFTPPGAQPRRLASRNRLVAVLAGITSVAAVGAAVLLSQLQPWGVPGHWHL